MSESVWDTMVCKLFLVLQAAEYWHSITGANGEKLNRSGHAAIWYPHLDHDHVLGWASHQSKKPPSYDEFLKVRISVTVRKATCCWSFCAHQCHLLLAFLLAAMTIGAGRRCCLKFCHDALLWKLQNGLAYHRWDNVTRWHLRSMERTVRMAYACAFYGTHRSNLLYYGCATGGSRL